MKPSRSMTASAWRTALGFASQLKTAIADSSLSAAAAGAARDRRLGKLLLHACRNTEFYAPFLRDVVERAPSDALRALPVSSKRVRMAHFQAFCTDRRINLDELASYFQQPLGFERRYLNSYLAFHTSGSTGQPSFVVWDEYEFGRATALWWSAAAEASGSRTKAARILGSQARSRIAYIGILDDYVGGNSWFHNLRHVAMIKMISIFDPLEICVRELIDFQPDEIVSKAHVLAAIARHVGKDTFHRLGAATMVGQVPTPPEIAAIQEGLGVEPRNSYATCETGPIGRQLGSAEDLRVISSQMIVELLDDQDQLITTPGVPGRVAVTSMYNYKVPLIRYDTGDLACYTGAESDVISYIRGRNTSELLFGEGGQLRMPEYAFWALYVPGVVRYQVIQRHWRALLIRVELAAGEPVPRDQVTHALMTKLARMFPDGYLASSVETAVEFVEAIRPESNGKIRITVPYREGQPDGCTA